MELLDDIVLRGQVDHPVGGSLELLDAVDQQVLLAGKQLSHVHQHVHEVLVQIVDVVVGLQESLVIGVELLEVMESDLLVVVVVSEIHVVNVVKLSDGTLLDQEELLTLLELVSRVDDRDRLLVNGKQEILYNFNFFDLHDFIGIFLFQEFNVVCSI